jgi:hypothetical protein
MVNDHDRFDGVAPRAGTRAQMGKDLSDPLLRTGAFRSARSRGIGVQVMPFQCSASGSSRASVFENVPTTHASSGPDADTLAKLESVLADAVACRLTVFSTRRSSLLQ